MKRSGLLLLLLSAIAVARADYIQFRNGGKIEGVIVGETDAELTIKTGPGSATFKKSQLSSIYRDASEANAKKEDGWRNEDFSNPEFLPAPLRPLATGFRALAAKQASALAAQRKLMQLRTAAANDETELPQLQKRRAAIVLKTPDATSREEVAAYNQLVQTSNELVTRMNAIGQRRTQLDELETAARTESGTYLAALEKFRTEFAAVRSAAPPDKQGKVFFTRAGAQLDAMNAALQELKIPITDARRGHAVVTARINGAHDARLLVDTGATYTSLSAATAVRMKLPWDKKNKSRAALADGREIDVYPVVIARLAVADVSLEHVQAIIIPDSPGDSLDGLLGMSFLREFDLQMDPGKGEIRLRRLRPTP